MPPEYEATFVNIDRDSVTKTLRTLGATLERPEHMQRRIIFDLPQASGRNNIWLRIRDEGDKITLSLKATDNQTITGQRELLLTIDSFDTGVTLLQSLGCRRKSYQESKRELWRFRDTEVSIDTWPFLEPYVEIEGPSEEAVENTTELLGLSYQEALFGPVSAIYRLRYGRTLEELDPSIAASITFQMVNPFASLHGID